jgi:hypothetical protein
MKVNTEELNRQASQLRRLAQRLNDLQDSVLRITRNLARESVGERFLPALTSAAQEIGKRSDDMGQMRRALQQIAEMYETAEMRIVDEAEHAIAVPAFGLIRQIRIPRFNPIDRIDPTPNSILDYVDRERLEELFRSWETEANTTDGSAETVSRDAVFVRALGMERISRAEPWSYAVAEFGEGSESIRSVQEIVSTVEAVVRERFSENRQESEFLIDRQVGAIVDGLEDYEIPTIDWTPWSP